MKVRLRRIKLADSPGLAGRPAAEARKIKSADVLDCDVQCSGVLELTGLDWTGLEKNKADGRAQREGGGTS